MPPRTIGRDLVGPFKQLGVDAVADNQPINTILAGASALVMLGRPDLPTMLRKMMAPSRGITTTHLDEAHAPSVRWPLRRL
jgi:hypothetical protein